jgi:uncharacterized protein YkwD
VACAAATVTLVAVGYLLAARPGPTPAATSQLTGSRTCSPAAARDCRGAAASPSLSVSSAIPRESPSPTPTSTPAASPSPTVASSPSAPPSADDAAAAAVLAVINQARVQAGLPAYTILAGLEASSAQHNMLMADGCGLSHQCPGEPALGDRETAAGVTWTAAGENIGEGGPVADTTAAISQMAVTLTNDMLAEQPPDDGHRLNILSSSFTHVGITVSVDGSGTVWMTQDFAN